MRLCVRHAMSLQCCHMAYWFSLAFLIVGKLLSKCSEIFHTFPLAVTNTLGMGGIAVIALVSML